MRASFDRKSSVHYAIYATVHLREGEIRLYPDSGQWTNIVPNDCITSGGKRQYRELVFPEEGQLREKIIWHQANQN